MQLDFNTPIHVYFSGIGGISMSGLARILKSRGFTVSGSDRAQSALIASSSDKRKKTLHRISISSYSQRRSVPIIPNILRLWKTEFRT